MFIISDINGKLIQCGNFDADIEELKSRFSTIFNTELIGTEDEELYNKALLYENFKLKVENGNIVDIIPKENLIDLDEYKQNKILQSKQQLAEFLENNPLLYNGEFYSVAQEKQSLLTSAIAAYQLKVQAGIPATLKWNTTGDICREFTLEEITGLVVAITEYVQPRVERQQELEVQIKNCENIEELDSIVIDYEEV